MGAAVGGQVSRSVRDVNVKKQPWPLSPRVATENLLFRNQLRLPPVSEVFRFFRSRPARGSANESGRFPQVFVVFSFAPTAPVTIRCRIHERTVRKKEASTCAVC